MEHKFFKIQHKVIRIYDASIERVQTIRYYPLFLTLKTRLVIILQEDKVITVALMEDQTIIACVWVLIKTLNPNKNLIGSKTGR